MYPLRLPWAVESQTSSAATKRTSMGNGTATPAEFSQRRTSVSAAGTASIGIAYSISRNRTRRGVTNTSWLAPVYEIGRASGRERGERAGVLGGSIRANRRDRQRTQRGHRSH